MTNTGFYTKDGWLTPYALACGYVEQKYYGPVRITLFFEHGCYHVRAYDHDQKVMLFWKTFSTVTEARRYYKRQRRNLNTYQGEQQ